MSIRDNLVKKPTAVLDTMEEIEANTEKEKAAGALAINELLNSLKWKYVGNASGAAALILPNGWKELMIQCRTDSSTGGVSLTNHIIREMIEMTTTGIFGAASSENTSGTNTIKARLKINASTINIDSIHTGSTDVLSKSSLIVWYK